AIYCGVREFSGDEGIIGIPDWLLEELQVQDEDAVVVETVKLEKGQFAQLQLVEDRETPQNMDVRAVLESHMRQRMTALFVGETICVNVGGQSMPIRFTVSALEPASAVDIVDTDLSVDIVNQQNQTQDRQTSIAELVPDKTQKITIGSSQNKQTYRLHVPAQTAAVEAVLECHLGDASLFASRLVRDAGVQDNDWSDVSAPSHTTKRLYIGSSQFSSISGTDIYVSVVGFTPECQANLVVHFDTDARQVSVSDHIMEQQSHEPGMVICTNCGSSIPEARLDMHRIMCERHNVKCSHCSRIFKRGSDELAAHWHCSRCNMAGEVGDEAKHDWFYHTPCKCSCDLAIEYDSLVSLAEHRRSDCPERLIECRYCHTYEQQGPVSTSAQDRIEGLRAHEAYCGSRSIKCAKCDAHVAIRQVRVHMMLHEARERERRENMVPCANKECTRERADNPLGLCSACFGQFYTGQYDPGNQKLLRRLARTLHTQMTQGCGRSKCSNAYCATGSPAGALSQTAAAAKMVPVLKAYAPLTANLGAKIDYRNIELHLCV
ncbi:hypothetical protein GGI05_005270, partial [Coemansia sp. RSA 2603]